VSFETVSPDGVWDIVHRIERRRPTKSLKLFKVSCVNDGGT
jgi:hypothetical protein